MYPSLPIIILTNSFHGNLIQIENFPSEEVGIKDILLDLQDKLKVLVLLRQTRQQLDWVIFSRPHVHRLLQTLHKL